jgi:hypothetical protein
VRSRIKLLAGTRMPHVLLGSAANFRAVYKAAGTREVSDSCSIALVLVDDSLGLSSTILDGAVVVAVFPGSGMDGLVSAAG